MLRRNLTRGKNGLCLNDQKFVPKKKKKFIPLGNTTALHAHGPNIYIVNIYIYV